MLELLRRTKSAEEASKRETTHDPPKSYPPINFMYWSSIE
jgi:hypothetical protein